MGKLVNLPDFRSHRWGGNLGSIFNHSVLECLRLPTQINSDFELLASGNFDGTPTVSDVQNDLFFSNPTTGANRIVFADGSIQNTSFAPTVINGNDFQEVYVGQFVDGGSDELFFLNLSTGASRRIEFSTITPGIESGVASIVIGSSVSQSIFNDSDDRVVQVVDLNGDGLDDVFLWDPTTGNNRINLTDFGPQA